MDKNAVDFDSGRNHFTSARVEESFKFKDLEKVIHEMTESMNEKLDDLKGALEKIDDDMKQIRNKSDSQHNDFMDALLLDDDQKSDRNHAENFKGIPRVTLPKKKRDRFTMKDKSKTVFLRQDSCLSRTSLKSQIPIKKITSYPIETINQVDAETDSESVSE